MLTGYNTDVRHNSVVFHVQTEDKGRTNPLIESLVYVGGQVLASKRASYAELLANGSDDKDIVALMDRQHRTLIAAIRHGKLDQKLAALQSGKLAKDPAAPPAAAAEPIEQAGAGALDADFEAEPPPPLPEPPAVEAGERPPEPSLDQVILEYLTTEAEQEQLVLLLEEGEDGLALGRLASVRLSARSSKSGEPVPGAAVRVKLISTISQPMILAAGRTREDGSLRLEFRLPDLERGTAALIVSATSSIGSAELKQLL